MHKIIKGLQADKVEDRPKFFVIEKGTLYREAGDGNTRLALPYNRVKEVIEACHDGFGGGHLGQDKTLRKVKEWFWWPNAYTQVMKWVESCEVCAKRITQVQGKLC